MMPTRTCRWLLMTLLCCATHVAARAARPEPASVPMDSSAVSSPEKEPTRNLETRLFIGLPAIYPQFQSGAQYGNIDLRYTSFHTPASIVGIGIEGGLVGVFGEGIDLSPIPPVLPYLEVGPVLRFGNFTIEGNAGVLVLLPYVSGTLAYRFPVAGSLSFVAESGVLAPLIAWPNYTVYAGGAIAFR